MKNVADVHPLTPTQAGMLYELLRNEDPELYFEQVRADLKGDLDTDLLLAAWQATVQNHAALRTLVLWEGLERPTVVVRKHLTVPFRVHDWTSAGLDTADALDTFACQRRLEGFDLSHAPLMDVDVIRVNETTAHIIWNFHHIVLDGWSASLIFDEVLDRYHGAQLPKAPEFREYVAWLQEQDEAKASAHWEELLRGLTAPTLNELPRATTAEAFRHQTADLRLPADSTALLADVARVRRCTMNTLVQAAWSVVQGAYSGSSDTVFGVTTSGRPAELEGVSAIAGLFLSTLPLRVGLPSEQGIGEWLGGIQDQQLTLNEFQFSSLADITRQSELPPGTQLFDTILIFENFPQSKTPTRSLVAEGKTVFEQTNYPLTLMVGLTPQAEGEHLDVLAHYDGNRFSSQQIDAMLAHLSHVLSALPAATVVGDLLALPAEDIQRLTFWSNGATAAEREVTIAELFAERVAGNPDAVAVRCGEERLTFAQLDASSNQLANYLLANGVNRGDLITVAMPRSLDLTLVLVAVVKASCAYVPLDPRTPVERRTIVVDESGSVLLVTPEFLSGLDLSDESSIAPELTADPGDPVVIPFTSGSTGIPKGVLAHHRGLINRLQWQWTEYPVVAGEVIAAKTSISFVDHLWEIWGCLLSPGVLLMIPDDVVTDPETFISELAASDVRRLSLVPSLLGALIDRFDDLGERLPKLTYWTVSGEAMPSELAVRFARAVPDGVLLNLYGMSEASQDVTFYDGRWKAESGAMPIGRPISNMAAVVLDRRGRLAPPGVPGEIHVSGVGVASGYLNQPELTADRFVPNPFDGRFGSETMYRTGDVGRWLPSGNLEYLGRTDSQVKIRGARVELGDVEAALRQHPDVTQAAVIVDTGPRDQRLVAFVASPESLNPQDVRAQAANHVPDFMVPAVVHALADLPLNQSGKVDVVKLRSLHATLAATAASPKESEPATQAEQQMVELWERVTGFERIEPDSDFFDLGGHSLLAIRLFSEIKTQTGVNLPVSALIRSTTPRALARELAGLERTSATSDALRHLVPLTSDQSSVGTESSMGTESSAVTEQPNLFIVHGAGGNVLNFRDLAGELADIFQVFGIQAAGVDGAGAMATSIEEIVTSYVSEIQRVQPRGPYHLSGFSIGGLVAYELAQRLQALGETVATLVLLDTFHPSCEARPFPKHLHVLNALKEGPGYVRRKYNERQLREQHANAPRIDGPVALDQVESQLTRRLIELWSGYVPSGYDGHALLLSAQEMYYVWGHIPAHRGWLGLISELEIVKTPGDHITLVEAPHAKAVASQFRRLIAAAEAHRR